MNSIKNNIKLIILKMKWKKRNKNNSTSPNLIFDINKVKVGNYTYGYLNVVTYDCPNSELLIGNFCSIGGNVIFLLGGEHDYNKVSTFPFGERIIGDRVDTISKGKIIVDDDVWIGHGTTILSGVHIGQGAIVGAGSIVSKNIPPYAIYAGNKIIKYRFNEDVIDKLLKIDYSKLTKETIKNNIEYLSKKCTKDNVDEIINKLFK